MLDSTRDQFLSFVPRPHQPLPRLTRGIFFFNNLGHPTPAML